MKGQGGKRAVHKCSWTPEEDETLLKLVQLHGPKKWSLIAHSLEGRIGKQCRERWHNHLNPDVRKDAWTPEEDELIFELVEKMGTKWATIAKYLNGRTDNSIKNRYYSSLKKFHDRRKGDKPAKTTSTTSKKARALAAAAAVAAAAASAAEESTNPSPTPRTSSTNNKRRRQSVISSSDDGASIVSDSEMSEESMDQLPLPYSKKAAAGRKSSSKTSNSVTSSPTLPTKGLVERVPTQMDYVRIAHMARIGALNMENIAEICASMGVRVQVVGMCEAKELIQTENCVTMPVAGSKRKSCSPAVVNASPRASATTKYSKKKSNQSQQPLPPQPSSLVLDDEMPQEPHHFYRHSSEEDDEFANYDLHSAKRAKIADLHDDHTILSRPPPLDSTTESVDYMPQDNATQWYNQPGSMVSDLEMLDPSISDFDLEPIEADVQDEQPARVEDDLPPLSLVSEYHSMLQVS